MGLKGHHSKVMRFLMPQQFLNKNLDYGLINIHLNCQWRATDRAGLGRKKGLNLGDFFKTFISVNELHQFYLCTR